MNQIIKNRYAKKLKKYWRGTSISIILGLIIITFTCAIVLFGHYLPWSFNLRSKVAEPLRIFNFNETAHPLDSISSCWYDSGDYVIFAQRNALTSFYLSYAYLLTEDPQVKYDIKKVLTTQLHCLSLMMNSSIKQIRDQDSHGLMVSPIIHSLTYPQTEYHFNEGEGRDVALLLSLIYRNLEDKVQAEYWLTEADQRNKKTVSENCCEEGPLSFSDGEFSSLEMLANGVKNQTQNTWGLSLTNILLVDNKRFEIIGYLLKDVQYRWDDRAPQFDYLGGNYDIAGMLALEKIYELNTNDFQYRELADKMYNYLHGINAYNIDFTDDRLAYHPCTRWWATCNLKETLMNGVDESGKFDLTRKDVWRNTEIQLYGQSIYLIAYILYNHL